MKNKYELTEEEKLIEKEADNFTPIGREKKKRIENIIEQTKKNKAISLRIANYDLEKIKEKAEQEGLPDFDHKYFT